MAARAAYAVLTRPGPTVRALLRRARAVTGSADRPEARRCSNFRGRTVTLQEGPALVGGTCAAVAVCPSLAPLVSSLAVVGFYLAFVPLASEHRQDLSGLPLATELVLSAGTTVGVAALFLTVIGGSGLAAVALFAVVAALVDRSALRALRGRTTARRQEEHR